LTRVPNHSGALDRSAPLRVRDGEQVDLGLWNVFANPDFPNLEHQRRLARVVCRALGKDACRVARDDRGALLDAAMALFKTPGLRDLGHSGPYFHDGSADTLEDVVQFYRDTAARARAGLLRNAAPELLAVDLRAEDVAPLTAFLRSLNEDYE
jgi:cytochrome c peroxidase